MNVYLDYAATTPVDGDILEKMLPFFGKDFGNPDSLHSFGRASAYAVSEARDRIARVLGVLPQEVYFTSGGTEADGWAVRALARGKEVLSSPIEHAAVLENLKLRKNYRLCKVEKNGVVCAEQFASELNERVGLACLMAVNNETGCVQPVEEVYRICNAKGVLLFCDGVQAQNSFDLKVLAKNCDALALSGHKIYAPKGVGALVVKKGISLSPWLAGGEQERGLRGGTLNVASIVGFSYALEKAQKEREQNNAKTQALRDEFEREICAALGEGVTVDGENRIGSISHLTFTKGGEAFLNKLDLHGVACSGGAACSAHSALPSHVMLAMGKCEEEAKRGVRFSFGKDTTREEVRFAIEQVIACAKV